MHVLASVFSFVHTLCSLHRQYTTAISEIMLSRCFSIRNKITNNAVSFSSIAIFSPTVSSSIKFCSSSSSDSTDLVSLTAQVASIVQDSRNGGKASQMLSNANLLTKPWEASCIEVQTDSGGPKTCPIRSRTRNVKAEKVKDFSELSDEEKAERRKKMKSYIVLYYETHTDEGLMAFRAIARRVSEGSLPGQVENRSAFGFAMWKVPANDFLILNSGLKLEE